MASRPTESAVVGRATLQVRAPQTFHDRTLWPEFLALSKELEEHLDELTNRVIREAIHDDVTEAPETTTKALPAAATHDASRTSSAPGDGGEPGSTT